MNEIHCCRGNFYIQEKRWDKQSPDFPIRVMICLDTIFHPQSWQEMLIFLHFLMFFVKVYTRAFKSKEKVYVQVKHPL